MIITTKTTKKQLTQLSPPCRCKACEIGCFYGSGVLDDADTPNIAKHLNISVEQLKKEYLEEIEKFHTKKFRPRIIKKETTEKNKQMPFGQCIFFDKGCTIHDVKPMECAVSSGCNGHGETINQWVMIKQFVNPSDAESVRQWHAWTKDKKPMPGANIQDIVPDKERLKKIMKYEEM